MDEKTKNIPELTEVNKYTWWLEILDEKFWKLNKSDYIVLVWSTWHWKTEFALFQAIQNAKVWNKVCFISLEMSPNNLIDRLCKRKANITVVEDNNKNIPTEKMLKYTKCRTELLQNENLEITWLKSYDIEDIITFIKEQAKNWYTLFYIDNFWLISSNNSYNETELSNEIILKLKQLTNELWIAIVWIHYFKKWDYNSHKGLTDIRWSGKIENIADYILSISRCWENMKLKMLKNRMNWILWKCELMFKNNTYVIDDTTVKQYDTFNDYDDDYDDDDY